MESNIEKMGDVELTLIPLKKDIATIRLNAKQCHIHSVTFNDTIDVSYGYIDPFAEMRCKGKKERSLKPLTKLHSNAVHQTDPDRNGGEIVIRVPPKLKRLITEGKYFRITIQFSLERPKSGVQFVIPNGEESFAKRGAHMFTYCYKNSSRLWFPCLDSYAEPCTWRLEFTVDKDMTAVSCGDLVEVVYTQDMQRKTYYYDLNVPTVAPKIALAVGPFEVFVDPYRHEVTHFCIPGLLKSLKSTVQFTHKVFEFYEELLSTHYPYSCYKQVFVDEFIGDVNAYASMSILTINLIHPPFIIDQQYFTRRALAQGIAEQYFGCFLSIQKWNDTWLSKGLSLYVCGQYLKKCFGMNAYIERIYKDLLHINNYEEEYGGIILDPNEPSTRQRKIQDDHSHQHEFHFPLKNLHTISPLYMEAYEKKAELVIRIIELDVGFDVVLQVLNKQLSLAFKAATRKQSLQNMLLSTNKFAKALSTVTGKDMMPLFEQWIRTGGHVKFHMQYTYNKRRNTLEVEIRQETALHKGIKKYVGPVTVAVQEFNGTFCHEIHIKGVVTKAEITCHTKSRTNKKKKIPLCTGEEVVMDFSGMELNSPVLWIRIDPEMAMFRSCSIEQPDHQWQLQLLHERDVSAQLEAIVALERFPSNSTRKALTLMIENEQAYVEVRCAAAFRLTKVNNMLISCTPAPSAMIAVFRKLFGSVSCPRIIKQNDFQNLHSYFLQKALPVAIARLRTAQGICPEEVMNFLFDLFKYNDNSRNKFSDNYYRAALMDALGDTIAPVIQVQQGEIRPDSLSNNTKLILETIVRAMNVEKVLSSYKLVMTIACLKVIRKLQRFGHLPSLSGWIRSYAKHGVFVDLRLAALEALVDYTCLGSDWSDLQFLLRIAEKDPDPGVRFAVVKMLIANPPFRSQHTKNPYNRPELANQIWKAFNILNHDSRMRCIFIDLYYTLYGVDRPKCLPLSNSHGVVKTASLPQRQIETRASKRKKCHEPDDDIRHAKGNKNLKKENGNIQFFDENLPSTSRGNDSTYFSHGMFLKSSDSNSSLETVKENSMHNKEKDINQDLMSEELLMSSPSSSEDNAAE